MTLHFSLLALFIHRTAFNIRPPQLFLNAVPLEYCTKAKNLGVIFNAKLDWTDHCISMCQKVNFIVSSLRKLSFLTSTSLRLQLVRSLAIPHFLYCDVLFYNMDSASSRRVTTTFNNCVRFIYNLRRFDHVSEYRNSILGCDLWYYYLHRVSIFLYKLIFLRHPSYLYSLISFASSNRTFNLIPPRHSTTKFKKSLFVYGTRIWNCLPVSIKTASSLGAFRVSSLGFFATQFLPYSIFKQQKLEGV